jgi:hypothetical protein
MEGQDEEVIQARKVELGSAVVFDICCDIVLYH